MIAPFVAGGAVMLLFLIITTPQAGAQAELNRALLSAGLIGLVIGMLIGVLIGTGH